MQHLIICREYPPVPSGGIGTYALNLSQLLAEAGETVHVIGQMWEQAERKIEERCHGRLIIHRVPFEDWTSLLPRRPHPDLGSEEAKSLFKSGFPPQCFSWQATLLAEDLVENEGIDIVEASDFEAPLYYFQLRRALGKGPKRQPPCFVHLHSPTEFIARHNGWDLSLPSFLTAKRLEDYSIRAADALLCPSRYLARQAEAHYGLADGTVRVIPYPPGQSRMQERDNLTWQTGSISYVGRLELRKGVLEWIDAAVAVSPEYPDARFEFVGADTLDPQGKSVRAQMERRIPNQLKRMFSFRGSVLHSSLPKILERARIAVVPSRWDNFPYSCIEAMASGLPVIASREGGMVELIADGRTGWLASQPSIDGFVEALRRALETPTTKISEMGRDAASDIQHICGETRILEEQLDFRRELIRKGPKRSLRLSVSLPTATTAVTTGIRHQRTERPRKGVAIVVTGLNLNDCLQSVERQLRNPASVVVVDDSATEQPTFKALNQFAREGWQVIRSRKEGGTAAAKNAGIKAILDAGINPIGFAFLSGNDRLESGFIDICERVLQRCPEVGLVSCWAQHSRAGTLEWLAPCPSFPYQWLKNEAAPFSVVRTEALTEAGWFRSSMSDGYEQWDLFNAVMAAGWAAVTVPEILGRCRDRKRSARDIKKNGNQKAHRKLLERFPDLVARDAVQIALLRESNSRLRKNALLMRDHFALARVIMRYPRDPALRALSRLKNKLLRRTPTRLIGIIARLSNLTP